MNEAGKQEAMDESITAGEKDYSALVSKLKQANIDVVYSSAAITPRPA